MNFANIVHLVELWLTTHPQWLFLFIMLVAAAESLAILGMLVPGIILLFVAGVLVGKGFLGLEAALIAGMIGAFIGDIASFFLGHLFHAHIRKWWIVRKHKNWVDKGENFFLKHGGKSVFIGRFAGPLRAIIPMIAGMLGMSSVRFILIDIVASILWSMVYLLPGYLVGASLHWTEVVSREFVYTVFDLVLFAWTISFLHWKMDSRISDENRKNLYKVFTLLLSIIFIGWVALYKAGFLNQLNETIAFSVLHGETLLTGKIAVMFTLLGSNPVQFVWAVILSLAFYFDNGRKTAFYFGMVFTGLIISLSFSKWGLNIARPPNLAGEMNYSFPSGHTAMTTFLALVLFQQVAGITKQLRFPVWGAGLFISCMVAVSRLYLNVHWFADVVGALILGAVFYYLWLYIQIKADCIGKLRHPILIATIISIVTIALSTILYPYSKALYLGI